MEIIFLCYVASLGQKGIIVVVVVVVVEVVVVVVVQPLKSQHEALMSKCHKLLYKNYWIKNLARETALLSINSQSWACIAI